MAMIIQDTLNSESFNVVVAHDGEEGLQRLSDFTPDVLVADIMMPRMDGFEMVRRIRAKNKVIPILFLTARSAINDLVEGFELGGDDYLRKPFSMLELIVRIKALAMRNKQLSGDSLINNPVVTIKIGCYTLCPSTQVLTIGERSRELSHRESEILRLLAENSNDVVTSKSILISLWGDDTQYNARSLQVFITKLRHYLRDDKMVKIINVRGIGYKLIT